MRSLWTTSMDGNAVDAVDVVDMDAVIMVGEDAVVAGSTNGDANIIFIEGAGEVGDFRLIWRTVGS